MTECLILMSFDQQNELDLFEALAENPEISQADLAARVGVAVGTVNWYLKRWSEKGYVKVKRMGRWRWRYLLTPQGMAEKANLASKYFEYSFALYRQTREQATLLLGEVKRAGYEQVIVAINNDVAEICQLTCLELGLGIVEEGAHMPKILLHGRELKLEWPEENKT